MRFFKNRQVHQHLSVRLRLAALVRAADADFIECPSCAQKWNRDGKFIEKIKKSEIDTETPKLVKALVDIHEVLKNFNRDDRQRIIAAANALIGNK